MKKIFTLFCVTLFSIATMANGVEVNGIYYLLDSMTASVTYMGTIYSSGNNYTGDVVIPDTIVYEENKYAVTSISERAFYECKGLTSITISNSVTSIGNYAFRYCSGLTSVTIPNSVTTIGGNAFYNVNNIVYSGTATGSPWGAKCMNGYVDGYLVYSDATKTKLCGCSSAVTGAIIIPNSVTTIGNYAFEGCSGFTSVTIPNSVRSIGISAFASCSNLTSMTIPNSVTTIESSAFKDCSGLTSVTIPNSVTTIGNSAFEGCSSLTSVIIPNSIKRLESSVFENCSSLTSITIPNSITSIKNHTFDGCSSLASISVEDGNTIYDSRENCNAIIETATNTLIVGCKNTIIPNSVTTIGNYAFCGSGLTSIIIPDSVTTIGNHAFYDCNNLKSITSLAHIPPYLEDKAFGASIVLYVPDTIAEAYSKSGQWNSFAITPCSYIINNVRILPNPIVGKPQVNIDSNDSSLLIIFAPDVNDFIFSQWSDGDTTNPRLVRDTQDVVISAKYTHRKIHDVVVDSLKTTGRSFWVALPIATVDRVVTSSCSPSIAIASKVPCIVNISNPNTGWSTQLNVQADSWTNVVIPLDQLSDWNWTISNCGERIDNKGLLVESTTEVAVYAGMHYSKTGDISNILPITAIRSEYILQDYPPSNGGDAHAAFVIVADENNTTIDITPSTSTVGGRPANATFTITLNKGQTYQVLSANEQSFSGTHVIAREGKKISVFSGVDYTQIPAGIRDQSYLLEQAIPVDYWGNEFVVTQSLDKDANRIRITAKEDSTFIEIDKGVVAVINAGQTYEFEVSNNLATTDMASKILAAGGKIPDVYSGEAHYIQTSHPVAVYSYDVSNAYRFQVTSENHTGDPSMVWISPLQNRVNNVTFGTFTAGLILRHGVNIVCLTADVDNVRLSSDYQQSIPLTFLPVPSNPTYSYARTPLLDTDSWYSWAPYYYTIISKYGVIAHVYGNGERESYAYSVGGPQWIPLVVDVDPIATDTTQLSWLPVDSASRYKLRIYSEQIELDTTLLIEADSLNGGISIPVTLAPNRVRRMPMDDIGSVVIITLEPNSGTTKDIPFKVTVSTTSKDKIDILFDLEVLKGETTIKQESGSFALNAPVLDGLEDIPMSRFGMSSGIYDLYGRHYPFLQWNQLPTGIYILREGEKASKVMKR